MEYLIFDCADNELYSHCLHIVTVCACAEVEVHTLLKRWQHPMAEISSGAILPEGAILPHSPLLSIIGSEEFVLSRAGTNSDITVLR